MGSVMESAMESDMGPVMRSVMHGVGHEVGHGASHWVSHEVGHGVIQMIGKEVDHGVGSIDKSHFRSSLCRSLTRTCKVSTRCRRDRHQYSTFGPMCPSNHPFLSQMLSFPDVSKYYKKKLHFRVHFKRRS